MQKACMFAIFRPQTYLPTLDIVLPPPPGPTYLPSALIARVDLPRLKKNKTLQILEVLMATRIIAFHRNACLT